MNTGENPEGLRKIIDMTRQISLVLLILHFYVYCYTAFKQWKLSYTISDKFLLNLHHTGLFNNLYISKLAALGFLLISLIASKGKKDEDLKLGMALRYSGFGLLIYLLSQFLFFINASIAVIAVLYITITSLGYTMILRGGALISRILQLKFKGDVFNKLNESFPQEERLLENEYSINLPAKYNLKGKVRKSWINIINPFRALLVIGTPGAGKSYFVIRHVITQHIRKGFAMLVYDFKWDDLTKIVYNAWLKYKHLYKVPPLIFFINLEKIYHRSNPLQPEYMDDITDAAESSRTIMLGLNREWIKKQGDFFVESPINFVTAIMWYLKKYRKGIYCTLPHVIELMQIEYHDLFSVLRAEPEIEVLINPFVSAYKNKAVDQLEGQIASAKISMARLASPQLYYVLSGSDFTLDLNNPDEPKIICLGNNPQKQQTYGAVLSLYISRIIKIVNRKGQLKSSLIFDEFPTIYFNGIDNLIATARSNKVATCLGVQDYSQLKKDYGREQAEVIMNIVGNVVSGQVVGETAKQLSERFGKIMQERESVSINSMETSLSKSMQLESAIPPSKISSLSSGEFVGAVADDPLQKIELKTFHAEIINDHEALKEEEEKYLPIPEVRKLNNQEIEQNYLQIKKDIKNLIETEIERMMNSPDLTNFVLKKIS
jgi:hypothetical protein